MKKNTIFLIISILINIGLLISLYMINKEQIPEIKCDWDLNIKDDDNFVFLGDSITYQYPIEEMYDENIPIIKSGISGYETKDILEKMYEMVYQYNPTKVFILIGTNDLKYEEKSEEEVSKRIIEIITGIKENRPKAKIYLESIYPVNRNIKDNGTENRHNDEIKKLNKILKDYCLENDVTYIDLYSVLVDENDNLKEKYTTDGLHITTKGYIAITKKLISYMN